MVSGSNVQLLDKELQAGIAIESLLRRVTGYLLCISTQATFVALSEGRCSKSRSLLILTDIRRD